LFYKRSLLYYNLIFYSTFVPNGYKYHLPYLIYYISLGLILQSEKTMNIRLLFVWGYDILNQIDIRLGRVVLV